MSISLKASEDGTKGYILVNGVQQVEVDSSGNVTVVGNVTADGKITAAAGTSSTNLVRFDQAFGVGQAWNYHTTTRSLGTTYTNTSTRSIYVSANVTGVAGSPLGVSLIIGGQSIVEDIPTVPAGASCIVNVSGVVAPGSTYRVLVIQGSASSHSWWEYK